MEILQDYRNFPSSVPTSITIGNFDGLHVGHQEILKNVVAVARESGTQSVLLTFSPHPLQILRPHYSPKSILSLDDKIERIRTLGIDYLLILKFDESFSEMRAETFIKEILVGSLHARHVFVGKNFVFGHNRSGNAALLQRFSQELGYTVEIIDSVEVKGKRVSSTWIRKLIQSGRISIANRLLGRPYAIRGPIVRGDRIGQKYLFPTLNLIPGDEIIPKAGVYITKVVIQRIEYPAVTNIGTRPTFSGKTLLVESYLMDQHLKSSPDLIEIQFLFRLRDEKKFPSIEALKAQIERDVHRASRYFSHLEHFQRTRLTDLKPL